MMETTVYATDIDPSKERSFNYTPESMAHPAKMPPCLVRALVLTYSKKGDTVLDPMAGIGTTLVESLLLGRNAVGVELEAKFAAWARANCEKATVNNTHSLVQRTLGKAVVIQGDARELESLLRENADGIIFSPPFGGSEQVSPGDREKKTETYKQGIDDEGYDDAASIAFKPTYGNVDAIVSSPPYADALTGDGEKAKAYMRQRMIEGKATSLRPDVFSTRAPSQQGGIWGGYGRSTGNIGNLRHGDIDDETVDAVVCSPPYSDVMDASRHPDSNRSKEVGEEKGLPRQAYGEKTNIGNLQHGNVDAIVSSPLFEGVEPFQDKDFQHDSWKKPVGENQVGSVSNYSEDKQDSAQLANLKGESYLQAMHVVYGQCFKVLRPGGYMCLVVKNFRRQGKEVDLEADTCRLCEHVGFQLYQKAIRTLHHPSFWQQNARQHARARGEPLLMPAHEYILVFRKPNAKNSKAKDAKAPVGSPSTPPNPRIAGEDAAAAQDAASQGVVEEKDAVVEAAGARAAQVVDGAGAPAATSSYTYERGVNP